MNRISQPVPKFIFVLLAGSSFLFAHFMFDKGSGLFYFFQLVGIIFMICGFGSYIRMYWKETQESFFEGSVPRTPPPSRFSTTSRAKLLPGAEIIEDAVIVSSDKGINKASH